MKSPPALNGATQTGNTVAVVGGVIVVVHIVAVTITAVVALLMLCCDLPARTPVQYVHIAQII